MIKRLNIKDRLLNIPVIYVFTKEYKDEIMYCEFMKKNIDSFKLKNDNYDVDSAIKILKKKQGADNYE